MRLLIPTIALLSITLVAATSVMAQDEATTEPTRSQAVEEETDTDTNAQRRAQRLGLDLDEAEMLSTVADVVGAATTAGIGNVDEVLELIGGCDITAEEARAALDSDSDGRVDTDINLEVLVRSQCTD